MQALLACLLVLALPQGSIETLVLKNGDHMRAEVLRLDNERAVLRVHFEGGSMQVTRRLDEFEPQSVYRMLRTSADPQKTADLLRLAEFAADNGLIWVAQRDLEAARRLAGQDSLAPELAQKVEDKGGSILEALFQRELDGNHDMQKARRLLSDLLIRFPGSQAAQRRDDLLARLREAELRADADKRAAAAALASAKADEARRKTLQAISEHIEDGAAENQRGLTSSKQFAVAHGHFQTAVQHFDKALRAAAVAAKGSEDSQLAGQLQDLRQQASRLQTDALLNAGSVCLVRGQYNAALGHVNSVLAIDPTNADARAMRARIEVAASYRGGYGVSNY